MIVGLDIDGVLADSVPAFLDLLNVLHGQRWTVDDITSYTIEETLGISGEAMTHFWKLFARQGRWGKIHPLPGAVEFTARIAAQHAVVLITGRPRHYVEVETRAWLRQHRFTFDDLIFLGKDNSKLTASREAGYQLDLLVEDGYEFGKPLADAGITFLLMDYPWNRNTPPHPNIVRVADLAAAEAEIARLAAARNGER